MLALLFQSFTLHFHFGPNDYFSDSVLTKEYDMKCEPTEDDPFSFEGPEIMNCRGCKINWKQGKNLTVSLALLTYVKTLGLVGYVPGLPYNLRTLYPR